MHAGMSRMLSRDALAHESEQLVVGGAVAHCIPKRHLRVAKQAHLMKVIHRSSYGYGYGRVSRVGEASGLPRRHARTLRLPSAVRRNRLQPAQKGCVIEARKDTEPA